MKMTDDRVVERCVERLCQDGCDKVYEYIEALRAGRELAMTGALSGAERQAVLDELLSIMAVYEGSSR